MPVLSEGEWADIFHYILPEAEARAWPGGLGQYRAACQIALGRWMKAHELEHFPPGEVTGTDSKRSPDGQKH